MPQEQVTSIVARIEVNTTKGFYTLAVSDLDHTVEEIAEEVCEFLGDWG